MTAVSRLHLAARRLQRCNLNVGQGLGAGVVDVRGDLKKRGWPTSVILLLGSRSDQAARDLELVATNKKKHDFHV